MKRFLIEHKRGLTVISLTSFLFVMLINCLPSINCSAYVEEGDSYNVMLCNHNSDSSLEPEISFYLNTVTEEGNANLPALDSAPLLGAFANIVSDYSSKFVGYNEFYQPVTLGDQVGNVSVDIGASSMNASDQFYNTLVISGVDNVSSIGVYSARGAYVTTYTVNTTTGYTLAVNPDYYYVVYTTSGDSSVSDINDFWLMFILTNGDVQGEYESGYEAGYEAGLKANDGELYDSAYSEGYQVGFNDGVAEIDSVVESDVLEMLLNPIDALFSFTVGVVGGYEITIGGIFTVVVSIWLLMIFLKIFAGG